MAIFDNKDLGLSPEERINSLEEDLKNGEKLDRAIAKAGLDPLHTLDILLKLDKLSSTDKASAEDIANFKGIANLTTAQDLAKSIIYNHYYFEKLSEVKHFEYTFYQQFQGLDIDKALTKTELTPYGLLNRLCDTQDLNGVLGQLARILRNEKYPNDIIQQEVARDFLELYYIKSNKHDTIPTETILKEDKNLGAFEEKLYSSIAETFENNKIYHFSVDSALKDTKFKAYDVLKSLAMTKQLEGENAALAIILLRENNYNSYPKNMEDFLETHYFSKELSQPLREKLDKELPKLINEISELFPSRTEPRLSLGENKRISQSTSALKIESPYHTTDQFINSEDFKEKLEILKSLDK